MKTFLLLAVYELAELVATSTLTSFAPQTPAGASGPLVAATTTAPDPIAIRQVLDTTHIWHPAFTSSAWVCGSIVGAPSPGMSVIFEPRSCSVYTHAL